MRTEQKKSIRSLRSNEIIATTSFGILVFVFFAFFYEHHLLFTEQLQLFLLTGDYFAEKMQLPGGLNGWAGGFLTQFWHIPVIGAMIISFLLVSIQTITKSILSEFKKDSHFFLLTFIPAIIPGFILCSELFPLSAVTGFTTAMAASLIYLKIKNVKQRFIAGIILIPAVYYLAGGAFISMVLIMTAYELIHTRNLSNNQHENDDPEKAERRKLKLWQVVLFIIIAIAFPLLIRQLFVFHPVKQIYLSQFYHNIPDKIPPVIIILFATHLLLIILYSLIGSAYQAKKYSFIAQLILIAGIVVYGYMKWVNPDAEEIMTYDYLVRNQKWNEVVSFAEKKPPRNYLSLAMLNLSLAKTCQLGDRMFHYGQHGPEGLFLRFEKEFISPLMGNEIFYHLGLINASQLYAFESMEVMPNMEKTVRTVKRLAETNLINGQYEAAGKYLKLLEKTLFYRKWASGAEKYLYNEQMIANHPDWGEKRKLLVKEDFFFHVDDIESILLRIIRENPENRIAFEYLASWYLLGRELDKFAGLLPVMEKLNYPEMPVSFQEAFLFYMSLTNTNPLSGSRFTISRDVISRMNAYAQIYMNNPNARQPLTPAYSGTYWYYFHYME